MVEASLGGVRRYIEEIVAGSEQFPHGRLSLAYADARSDSQFGALVDRAKEAGWETTRVPMTRATRPVADARSATNLRTQIQRLNPDVVHLHSSKAGGVGRIAVRMLRRPRPSVVYSPHAMAQAWQYRLIERGLSRTGGVIAASSQSDLLELKAARICRRDRLVVIPPAIDSATFAPRPKAAARAEIGVPQGATLIVGVGRLVPQKDPLTFVGVVSELARRGLDIQSLWVGDGELRGEVESAVHQAGLEGRFSITGWQDDVRPFFSAADVIVMPSRYEGLSATAGEVLSMEVPLAAAGVAGIVDLVEDGVTGALFPAGDAASGASAVERLLQSPTNALEMARAGRERIRVDLSAANMWGALTRAYTYATELDRRPRP